MGISATQNTYMNTMISRATQLQGQVLLKLLNVNEKVQTAQYKPFGNVGQVPDYTFEAVA